MFLSWDFLKETPNVIVFSLLGDTCRFQPSALQAYIQKHADNLEKCHTVSCVKRTVRFPHDAHRHATVRSGP